MFPLVARRRSGRFAVPDPLDVETRRLWVVLAIAAGWTFTELAADWSLSVTRIREIHRRALRAHRVVAAQIQALGVA